MNTENDRIPGAVTEASTSVTRKYLIFISDGLKLAIDAEHVVEIISQFSITFLPKTPDYIKGVFNMRGSIIPVMDLSLRMGKAQSTAATLLLVIKYRGTQIGLLVDSVDQMAELDDSRLLPPISPASQPFVSAMCAIPDGSGTMLVLDCERLLSRE
ncbi:MAG: chemotaxis protein CheW [Firmicutes bacterium]|nr:chemotaxis protein CheW [Bacillota bacterium]